jgi:hypothetical protein
MAIYGILFFNYFIYFSSSRMHISLPAVISTGEATYAAADNHKQKNNKLSVLPLLLLSLTFSGKSYRNVRGHNHTQYSSATNKYHIWRRPLTYWQIMSAAGLESCFVGFFAAFMSAASNADAHWYSVSIPFAPKRRIIDCLPPGVHIWST